MIFADTLTHSFIRKIYFSMPLMFFEIHEEIRTLSIFYA